MKIALVLLSLWVQEGAKENPLQPLTKIAKLLDEKAAAFLKGTPPPEAFAPWRSPIRNEKALEELREQFKSQEVASLSCFWIEVEFDFLVEGKPTYHLRTIVQMTQEETAFLDFRGSKAENESSRAYPPAGYKNEIAPFGEVGTSILAVVKAKDESHLPFADPDKLSKLFPEKFHNEIRKSIEKSRKNVAQALTEIAELKVDEVRIRVDDFAFVARDASGGFRGFFECEFEVHDNGSTEIELGKLRMPKSK